MIGYIYHIINIETGKRYIGQTIDIDWRLQRHFRELSEGCHHSQKLQRSYDKYGKEAFKVEYQEKEYKEYEDLLLDEQKNISQYNSYENGYNETRGGEGHPTLFDFDTMVLLYQIGQRYKGIKHKIAEFYNCDRTSITAVFRKDYLKKITYDEEKLNNLIKELQLDSSYLNENYVNNWDKKLNEEQVLMALSTMEIKKYSGAACGRVFGVKKDVINSITRGKTYKKEKQVFDNLSQEEKIRYAEKMCSETDIIRVHYESKRGNVKDPLTQEQVNYILENEEKMSITQIALKLGVSTDRVSGVKHRKSYLDMIWVYQQEHDLI